MIELLLQAERSLEAGSLDQAERLYWQAIDADSRNAIAIVGLAKVARRRGDDRTAIAFGRRALEVDGDDAVARRLVAELEAAHPATSRPRPQGVPASGDPLATRTRADAAPGGAGEPAASTVAAGSSAESSGGTSARSSGGTSVGEVQAGSAPDPGRGADAWPAADDRPDPAAAAETRRPTRADIEWPAADLKQVRPRGDR